MKKGLLPLSLLITLLISANAHAQLYKWVGPDGKITYSDTPPPSSAKKVEEKALTAASGPSTAGLPFELAQAVKNSPVTLYTTSKCEPCADARNLLNTRGVPFSEKTVDNNEEVARLKKLGGEKLPFATIGSQKQTGFNSELWDGALSTAGYPVTSQLPKNYKNPAPESAAPAKPKTAEAKPADLAPAPPTDTLPATGNAPPGFRF